MAEPEPKALTIRFISGPLSGQTFQITSPIATIGRDPANDLSVQADPRVSRRHARIVWDGLEWRIENLSRSAPIRVNDQETQQATLSHGAVVSLGETTTFEAVLEEDPEGDPQAQPVAEFTLPASPKKAKRPASTEPRAHPVTHPAGGAASEELANRIEATKVASLSEIGAPSLEVSSNSRSGKNTYPLTGSTISVGRDPLNDIVISDPIVSAQHLQIVREGTGYVLIHPHPSRSSTLNGLYYRGRKIRGDERFTKRLAPGDVFRIGGEQDELVTLRYLDRGGEQPEALPPIRPIKLDAPELTIGRDDDNTVVLLHPLVSAHHAKLTREGGAYRVTDLRSTNHVYVNSQVVTSQLLTMGDELRIGPYRLVYETTQLVQYDESQTIRLDAIRLSKRRDERTLLHDISLSIPPRSFVALVGASGAGKSTLLDALSGLRPADQGRVLYNGKDYYRHAASFESQIGYVPQEDIVHRELTIERALYYAAKLRLPGDFTPKQIEQRITEVLDDVELAERRSQLVRSLSGGQRKRVSLALELLANPSLFFLDEPTSGLDPGLDRKMMVLLRKLADKGHTIVLVTHATNNINVCDYVCFLASGGRLAYFGPPEDAKVYFGKAEFAEIYSALEATAEREDAAESTPERQDAAETAETRFLASSEFEAYIEQPLKQSSEGHERLQPSRRWSLVDLIVPWRQWLVLTTRYLELLRNDPVNLSILLLQAPVIALLLVSFTTTNVFINGNGVDAPARSPLFLMVVAAIWFGIINAVREIVKEAPIYRRERAMRLGVVPYVLSKVGVLGVLCLAQSLVLIAVIGWKAGFPAHGVFWPPFLELYVALALTSLSGLMIGLALSAVAPNADRAISLVPLIMLPEIIFSGAMFQLSGILGTVADIMATRWGFAALGGALHLRYFTFCAPLPPRVSPIGIPHGDCPIGATEGIPDQAMFGAFYPRDSQHLLLAWLVIVIHIVITLGLVIYFQKRKDAVRQ
jgi:ABC-type multidrug transport system ATPase subunit/pSer/pThr/pTyr-binding forkhead associated (FHA) protein